MSNGLRGVGSELGRIVQGRALLPSNLSGFNCCFLSCDCFVELPGIGSFLSTVKQGYVRTFPVLSTNTDVSLRAAQAFEMRRDNPFNFRCIRLLSSSEQLAHLQAGPKVCSMLQPNGAHESISPSDMQGMHLRSGGWGWGGTTYLLWDQFSL